MITIRLKDFYKNTRTIMLPHEVNNEFFSPASTAAEEGKIKGINFIPYFGDFWEVEYPVDKLDKLYKDFEVLEQNLDEITKVVPLPKTIGNFDGYYNKGFIHYRPSDLNKLKIFLDAYRKGEYIDYEEDKKNIVIEDIKEFTKEDMLLIISLIKKKILEAKEKGETLVFSGD